MNFLFTAVFCLTIFVGYKAVKTDDLVCADGEEYRMCGSPCEPTCDSEKYGLKINCSKPCVPGCFCRNGFVRAKDNTCVLPHECSRPICSVNEEYQECGSPCVHNCTNLREPIFCTKPCYPGCFCKHDYVRNLKGQCVDPRECFPEQSRQCGENEVYKNCVDPCNTCWEQGSCKQLQSCRPGCDCKPGFFRHIYGQCVPLQECFPYHGLCGENEEFSECVNPCNDCISKGSCDYQYFYCERGCDCKRGYFRNKSGVCVPEYSCYNKICKENEYYLECGPSCPATCDNYQRVKYLPCTSACVRGCFCRENFVLGPDGKCIPPEHCPGAQPSCPPGEQYYDCMPSCQTCDNYDNTSVICDTTCRKGCFCKPGLYRRQDGVCVPPNKCPPKRPACPPNEQYYVCKPTCRNTCDTYNDSSQVCSTQCVKGCFCKGTMVRRKDGVCVLPENCPPKQPICPPNEQYYVCKPTCRNTCDTYNDSSQACSTQCVKGCFCKGTMVRRKDGVCVLPEDCPIRPCLPGEVFYQCLPTCRKTCETLNDPDVLCSKSLCESGCFCQPGFVKKDGRCIRKEQCPPIVRRCPPGERFYNCTPTCRNSCDNLDSVTPCPEICRPGCFCLPGFVRGRNKRCVRPHSCPTVPVARPCGTCISGRKKENDDNSTEENTTAPETTFSGNETDSNFTQAATTSLPTTIQNITEANLKDDVLSTIAKPGGKESEDNSTKENTTLTITTLKENETDNSTQNDITSSIIPHQKASENNSTPPMTSTKQNTQDMTAGEQNSTDSIKAAATSAVTTVSTFNNTELSTLDNNVTTVAATTISKG